MDFSKWNKIAKGEDRTMKRVSELEMDRVYRIEDVRKSTTKYGDKVIACLEGNIYSYLPAKLSEALLAEDEIGLIELGDEVRNTLVGLRCLPPRGRMNPVEFLKKNLPEDAGSILNK